MKTKQFQKPPLDVEWQFEQSTRRGKRDHKSEVRSQSCGNSFRVGRSGETHCVEVVMLSEAKHRRSEPWKATVKVLRCAQGDRPSTLLRATVGRGLIGQPIAGAAFRLSDCQMRANYSWFLVESFCSDLTPEILTPEF